MKLMVQSYNNGGTVYNAETEETAFLSYKINHRFNEPAEATIVLSDPTGTIAQKYNDDANDVYIGAGKVTIEDPTATDIFFGRILRAEADEDNRTVTLYCEDWLSQLNDEQITYDMRRDLDSDDDTGKQGLRESYLWPDHDNATIVDVSYANAGNYYLYDDNRSWNADEFNGVGNTSYLILLDSMAGTKTWEVGPYDEVVTGDGAGIDADGGDETDLWEDESANSHAVWDNDENWTQDYYFRIHVGHNTNSVFYVDDSVSKVEFEIIAWFADNGTQASICSIQTYENNGPAWVSTNESLDCKDHGKGVGAGIIRKTIQVPEAYLNDIVDTNGIARLRFAVTGDPVNTTYLYVFYAVCRVTCDTIGYSSVIPITDTLDLNAHGGKVNCLKVSTDMTAAATQVWPGVRYSIAKPIQNYIASDETPGDLITGGDTMEVLTCAATIEHTSGISARQYKDNTRLEILQDLSRQDKAEFFITLGGTTVTYKSTWGANSNTITDTTVNSWRMTQDWTKVANEFNIYGMRIGAQQLYSNVTDATSIAKYNATRSRTERGTGLVSEYDTLARGTALVAQYKDTQKMLTATLAGLDTLYRLGTITEVTSTYLGISAIDYIIDSWAYDSEQHQSTITLHPKVSTTGLQRPDFTSADKALSNYRLGQREKFIASPEDEIV